MKKLKVKPDYWLIQFVRGKSYKRYAYLTYGFTALQVVTEFHSNPNNAGCRIVMLEQLIEED